MRQRTTYMAKIFCTLSLPQKVWGHYSLQFKLAIASLCYWNDFGNHEVLFTVPCQSFMKGNWSGLKSVSTPKVKFYFDMSALAGYGLWSLCTCSPRHLACHRCIFLTCFMMEIIISTTLTKISTQVNNENKKLLGFSSHGRHTRTSKKSLINTSYGSKLILHL